MVQKGVVAPFLLQLMLHLLQLSILRLVSIVRIIIYLFKSLQMIRKYATSPAISEIAYIKIILEIIKLLKVSNGYNYTRIFSHY